MREYLGARNARFAVFPGSVLKGRNPRLPDGAELVETSRLWARQNAAIKPEWAERLGAHLVKRTYSEPHWSRKRARGHGPRAGHAVRRPAGRRPARAVRQDRRAARPRALHPARARPAGVGHRGTGSSPRTPACSRRPRSSSTGPGAATSSSTSTPSSSSTTPASARTSSAARTSTSGGSGARQKRPDLLTFDPEMLTHDTAGEVRAARLPDAVARQRRGRADLPDQLPLRARRGRRRPHHRRPGRDPQPGRGRRLLLAGARAARGAGHRADPLAAQEPPRRDRARAQHRARVPRRDAAGRRAAARRPRAASRAAPAASSSRARRGTGPRSRRTCGRPTGWSTRTAPRPVAARTSTRSRSRCGPPSSRRWPTSPPTPA